MLCAGFAIFNPLIRNDAGPGKKVRVMGIGGLVSIYLHQSPPLLEWDERRKKNDD
jgi:D-arabinose 1-dehydrogenase-like Zn-dependent alcohol dehydrogenase